MTTMKQAALATTAVVIAAATAVALISTRQTPPKEEREAVAPLVEVITVQPQDVTVAIQGQGTVRAKQRAQIVPQVSGRVLAVHAGMVSGGFVPAGQPLIEIDPADYQLALQQAQAEGAQAQAALATAEAQVTETAARLREARIDLERMTRLNREGAANDRELDRFRLAEQVASAAATSAQAAKNSAEARLNAAKVAAEQAQLNLGRTKLTLPFDAVVTAESVDAGQFINAGQPLGQVYGAAAVEIPVPLEDSELAWFTTTPMMNVIRHTSENISPGDGAPLATATVSTTFAGRECVWPAQVMRTEGQIDPATRMVHVVVQVNEPLNVTEMGRPPLMPGAFVEVNIEGRMLDDVYAVPRHALREGGTLWIVEGGKLQVREIEIARRDQQTMYISRGLQPGDVVITSPMDVVANGMAVRTPEFKPDQTRTAGVEAN